MRWALRSALLLLVLVLVAVWAASLLEWVTDGEDLMEGAIYGSLLMPALVAPFAAIYLFVLYRSAPAVSASSFRLTALLLSPFIYALVFYNFGTDLFTSYGLIYLAAPLVFGALLPSPKREDVSSEPARV